MKKHLPADADRTVWIVSSVIVALAILFLATTGIVPQKFMGVDIVLYVLAGIALIIVAAGLLARPVRYEIRDDSLKIVRNRPLADITIPKSAIKEARDVKLGWIKPASIAIPGVFGYVGRFDTEEQGQVVMIATNPSHAVLVVADKRYLITPSNPKRFTHDLSGKK
jgi:hypothetical protein